MISGTEEYLSCYGDVDVGDGKDVMDGVSVGTSTVKEGVSVKLGVNEGIWDGVKEGVNVKDGVSVAGWKDVDVTDAVEVSDGVNVLVGVRLIVLVNITGVGLRVAVAVISCVGVVVGVAVRLPGVGASAIAMKPIQ